MWMGKVKGSMDGFGKTQETVVTYRGNNRKKSAVFGINKKGPISNHPT